MDGRRDGALFNAVIAMSRTQRSGGVKVGKSRFWANLPRGILSKSVQSSGGSDEADGKQPGSAWRSTTQLSESTVVPEGAPAPSLDSSSSVPRGSLERGMPVGSFTASLPKSPVVSGISMPAKTTSMEAATRQEFVPSPAARDHAGASVGPLSSRPGMPTAQPSAVASSLKSPIVSGASMPAKSTSMEAATRQDFVRTPAARDHAGARVGARSSTQGMPAAQPSAPPSAGSVGRGMPAAQPSAVSVGRWTALQPAASPTVFPRQPQSSLQPQSPGAHQRLTQDMRTRPGSLGIQYDQRGRHGPIVEQRLLSAVGASPAQDVSLVVRHSSRNLKDDQVRRYTSATTTPHSSRTGKNRQGDLHAGSSNGPLGQMERKPVISKGMPMPGRLEATRVTKGEQGLPATTRMKSSLDTGQTQHGFHPVDEGRRRYLHDTTALITDQKFGESALETHNLVQRSSAQRGEGFTVAARPNTLIGRLPGDNAKRNPVVGSRDVEGRRTARLLQAQVQPLPQRNLQKSVSAHASDGELMDAHKWDSKAAGIALASQAAATQSSDDRYAALEAASAAETFPSRPLSSNVPFQNVHEQQQWTQSQAHRQDLQGESLSRSPQPAAAVDGLTERVEQTHAVCFGHGTDAVQLGAVIAKPETPKFQEPGLESASKGLSGDLHNIVARTQQRQGSATDSRNLAFPIPKMHSSAHSIPAQSQEVDSATIEPAKKAMLPRDLADISAHATAVDGRVAGPPEAVHLQQAHLTTNQSTQLKGRRVEMRPDPLNQSSAQAFPQLAVVSDKEENAPAWHNLESNAGSDAALPYPVIAKRAVVTNQSYPETALNGRHGELLGAGQVQRESANTSISTQARATLGVPLTDKNVCVPKPETVDRLPTHIHSSVLEAPINARAHVAEAVTGRGLPTESSDAVRVEGVRPPTSISHAAGKPHKRGLNVAPPQPACTEHAATNVVANVAAAHADSFGEALQARTQGQPAHVSCDDMIRSCLAGVQSAYGSCLGGAKALLSISKARAID